MRTPAAFRVNALGDEPLAPDECVGAGARDRRQAQVRDAIGRRMPRDGERATMETSSEPTAPAPRARPGCGARRQRHRAEEKEAGQQLAHG